jgi:hypothetical protein
LVSTLEHAYRASPHIHFITFHSPHAAYGGRARLGFPLSLSLLSQRAV